VLRILHSRSVAEADTEAAVVAVSMAEVEEAASTVAVVEAADSMEAVAVVFMAEAAELIAAEVVACTAAAVRRVTLRAAWAPMDVAAACMAAVDRMACMAERVRTA
jgi:hypothetical protein